MIGTTLAVVAWGLVFLRRRSAAEVMVAHAFNDMIAVMIGHSMGGRVQTRRRIACAEGMAAASARALPA